MESSQLPRKLRKAADAAGITTDDAACRRTTWVIDHTTVVTLTRTTLAIGDATIALAYRWTSAQACGFISETILERGITMMMMIKPSPQIAAEPCTK
jgi:hypothetical protein